MANNRTGATPPPSGRPAPVGTAHMSHGRTPYRILAGIQALAALLCLTFALPGMSTEAGPMTYVAISAGLLLLAAITLWALPLLPRGYGVDVALGLGYALAAGILLTVATAEGHVLIGLGLSAYVVFAAYFLTKNRLLSSLVVAFLLLGLAERANPRMSSPAVYWMIVAVISGLAILVSGLVSRLRDLALHDELTQLLNRRGLDLLAPPLLAACARSGAPVTVGLIDLDHFKLYNDTQGHLAGDQLLRHVADGWQAELRESDLAARFGGDEYALVLVDTRIEDAMVLQSRVRRLCPATADGSATGWTAGWAEVAPGETLYQALDRADVELFAAKESRGAGRA